MTLHVKAHFDGKVIVPDEPVDLPVDEPINLHIDRPATKLPGSKASRLAAIHRIAANAISGDFPAEVFSRDHMYEDPE